MTEASEWAQPFGGQSAGNNSEAFLNPVGFLFQRKNKEQQLKGNIVSEFFTFFHTFSEFFSAKQRVLAQGEEKRRKITKKTGQIDVAR